MNFNEIVINNQILFPFHFEGIFYYIRFVRRGSRLDCSGVFRLNIEDIGNRMRPYFYFESKNQAQIKKIVRAAKSDYQDKEAYKEVRKAEPPPKQI